MQGLRSSLEKLQHNVDVQSDKFQQHIDESSSLVEQKFKQAHEKLDARLAPVHAGLSEVDEFLNDLEKLNNGAPSDGLSGSGQDH